MSALDDLARATLTGNDRGGYTVPNARVYPFQWNWDSAFAAMGFATFDIDRAWRELETLFLGQWPDGMVPSIVFHRPADTYYPGPNVWATRHQPPTSGISQPPVAATAARVIYNAAGGSEAARARASRLLPNLFASHLWWHETRDPDNTGLVTVVHPWETGRDNSPEWDAPLANIRPAVDVAHLRMDNRLVDPAERPSDDFYNRVMTLVEEGKALNWDGKRVARELSFRVCDLGVQSILIRADRDLLWLASELGFEDEADALRLWIARSEGAFMRLRHPGDKLYRSLDLITGKLAPTITSASFLPLYARTATARDVRNLGALLERWRGETVALVPSADPRAPEFDPARYWRGPVWLIINRLIADGFAGNDEPHLAQSLRAASRALGLEHGLREYFNPLSGEGLGGTDFSWSAAMWLAWAGRDDAIDRMTGA